MAASRCAINILTEESKSSRRARVQKELKHDPLRCGMVIDPTRAEESNDLNGATCCVPSCERPYKIVICLYLCVFDISYFRVRVSLHI